ncbi:hypothetical protein LguiA_018853 [Lonicera macranthoides]
MSITGTGHVAIFGFPFGSHARPLVTLVERLSAAAPKVIFSYFNTKISNQKISSCLNDSDNIKLYDVDDGAPTGYVFFDNPLEPVELFVKGTPENFKKSLAEVVRDTGMKVTCLLTDAIFWFSSKMAEEMGVPWVAFWTSGPFSVLVHIYTDVIRSKLEPNEKRDKTLNFLPGMSKIQAQDLPPDLLNNTPLTQMLSKMGAKLPQATALAVNSFEELDPTITKDLKSKVQKLFNIGIFSLSSPLPPTPSLADKNGCISWLNDQRTASVVYVSFGTILMPSPTELVALAEALETKKVPFLWSFKENQDLVKGKTGSLGKVVPWAPQQQVLVHSAVGVFVTHCGWNSLIESIAAGVPMICRPFFADQKLNSRTIEDVWQIGVKIEGEAFTKSGVIRAIDLVFSKEKGKKMRENIGVLKEKAKRAVETNGSSSENFKSLLNVVTNSKGN